MTPFTTVRMSPPPAIVLALLGKIIPSFNRGPRLRAIERIPLDGLFVEPKTESRRLGKQQSAFAVLELPVDQPSKIEHLVVRKVLDESRIRRGRNEMHVYVVE